MLKTLLSSHTGRIYVYLANEDICKWFLQDAEKEVSIPPEIEHLDRTN